MKKIYQDFAYVYDKLMIKNMNYNKWVEYIIKLIDYYERTPRDILDLACGTGNISISLASMGYNVIGIDISDDMLFLAREKAMKKGVSIPFICQDMISFSIHRPVDTIICTCDGMNYILKNDDILNMMKRVYKYLNPGGLFIFDISSYYKLSKIIGNKLMGQSDNEISFIWQNHFDYTNSICSMELTFFVRRNGSLYQRFDEIQKQRAYDNKEIYDFLVKTRFKNINIFKPFTFEKPGNRSHRIFFTAQK